MIQQFDRRKKDDSVKIRMDIMGSPPETRPPLLRCPCGNRKFTMAAGWGKI